MILGINILRLAKGALTAGFVMLTLCAMVSAGWLRLKPSWLERSPAIDIDSPEARSVDIYCTKFDEYSDLKFADEKPRLDNLAIQLQQATGGQGYYLIFGSCEGEADQRAQRAVDYLTNVRGIARSRITVYNGGCRETLTVELWICPKGSRTPTPSNMATVNPCPKRKAKTKPQRRGRLPTS